MRFTLEQNRVSFSEGHSSGVIPMGVRLNMELPTRGKRILGVAVSVLGVVLVVRGIRRARSARVSILRDWIHGRFVSLQFSQQAILLRARGLPQKLTSWQKMFLSGTGVRPGTASRGSEVSLWSIVFYGHCRGAI
jgi:hypothetical protein